jgi:hypothetical protein
MVTTNGYSPDTIETYNPLIMSKAKRVKVKLPKKRNLKLHQDLLGCKGGPMRDKRRESVSKPDRRLDDDTLKSDQT